jgi:type II secretory pathway component PulF
MLYAFNYQAKAKNGSIINGLIFSENEEEAYLSVKKKLNLAPLNIQMDIQATIGAWLSRDFNNLELAKLYKTIGKRLKTGRSIVDGLEQAQEFITDKKLKFAVGTMLAMIMDGYPEAQAMEEAGFPKRDCSAVAAGALGGKQPEIFLSMAEDYNRSRLLSLEIKKAVKPLFTMMILLYVVMYMLITVSAPKLKKFIDETSRMSHKQQDGFVQAYYNFTDWFNKNLEISTVLYLLAGIGVYLLIKSPFFSIILKNVKLIKNLNEKKEMASLWSSFGLLYDASVNVENICDMLMEAAKTQEIKAMFLELRNSVRKGLTVEAGVKAANFPLYVIRGVSFASLSDLGSGLKDFSAELGEDIEMMTEQVKELVKYASLITSASFVMMFFGVSYYPILTGALKNL